MSTGYKQFENEGGSDGPTSFSPSMQPQSHPPQYSTNYPGGDMVPMVAPQPQTIISTTMCQPNDYFGLALFVTICCCLPLGIVGLIKANDVRNRFQAGDIAGAEEASQEAKRYSYIGLGIGIAIIAIAIITSIVLVVVLVVDVENDV